MLHDYYDPIIHCSNEQSIIQYSFQDLNYMSEHFEVAIHERKFQS